MKGRKQSKKRSRTNFKRIKKTKKRLQKNKRRRLLGGGPMINKPCKCGYLNFNTSEIGNELKLELTK